MMLNTKTRNPKYGLMGRRHRGTRVSIYIYIRIYIYIFVDVCSDGSGCCCGGRSSGKLLLW